MSHLAPVQQPVPAMDTAPNDKNVNAAVRYLSCTVALGHNHIVSGSANKLTTEALSLPYCGFLKGFFQSVYSNLVYY